MSSESVFVAVTTQTLKIHTTMDECDSLLCLILTLTLLSVPLIPLLESLLCCHVAVNTLSCFFLQQISFCFSATVDFLNLDTGVKPALY